MKQTTIVLAAIFAVLGAGLVEAYPSVTIGTPYSAPTTQTTVVYNPWSGNTYVDQDNRHTRQTYTIGYAEGYYDGKYRRNPFFCEYDWFDRCKNRANDPDYWYDRCRKYDWRDDEWFDRGCDIYYGQRRSAERSIIDRSSPIVYNYRPAPTYVVDSYPKQIVYYVEEKPYTSNYLYGGRRY